MYDHISSIFAVTEYYVTSWIFKQGFANQPICTGIWDLMNIEIDTIIVNDEYWIWHIVNDKYWNWHIVNDKYWIWHIVNDKYWIWHIVNDKYWIWHIVNDEYWNWHIVNVAVFSNFSLS